VSVVLLKFTFKQNIRQRAASTHIFLKEWTSNKLNMSMLMDSYCSVLLTGDLSRPHSRTNMSKSSNHRCETDNRQLAHQVSRFSVLFLMRPSKFLTFQPDDDIDNNIKLRGTYLKGYLSYRSPVNDLQPAILFSTRQCSRRSATIRRSIRFCCSFEI